MTKKNNEKRTENEQAIIRQLCDKGSVVYNTTSAGGSAVAPIIGGFLDDKYGFRITSDIMAFATLGLAAFFLLAYIEESMRNSSNNLQTKYLSQGSAASYGEVSDGEKS